MDRLCEKIVVFYLPITKKHRNYYVQPFQQVLLKSLNISLFLSFFFTIKFILFSFRFVLIFNIITTCQAIKTKQFHLYLFEYFKILQMQVSKTFIGKRKNIYNLLIIRNDIEIFIKAIWENCAALIYC